MIANNLTTTVSDCKPSAMSDDIAALEHWVQTFEDPKTLAYVIYVHLIYGGRVILKDIK